MMTCVDCLVSKKNSSLIRLDFIGFSYAVWIICRAYDFLARVDTLYGLAKTFNVFCQSMVP